MEVSRHRRRLSSVLIAAAVLLHLLVPLRFYLIGTAPDERFCWRMFSTLQADLNSARTTVRVTESKTVDGQHVQEEVPLGTSLSQPWVEFLHRLNLPVIDKFLRWQRDRSSATEVRFLRTVTLSDGTSARPVQYSLGIRPQQ